MGVPVGIMGISCSGKDLGCFGFVGVKVEGATVGKEIQLTDPNDIPVNIALVHESKAFGGQSGEPSVINS